MDDGTKLVLAETTGPTGFSYQFDFGKDEDVSTTNLNLNLAGNYGGNVGHNIKLQQWNFVGTSWDNAPLIFEFKNVRHEPNTGLMPDRI